MKEIKGLFDISIDIFYVVYVVIVWYYCVNLNEWKLFDFWLKVMDYL